MAAKKDFSADALDAFNIERPQRAVLPKPTPAKEGRALDGTPLRETDSAPISAEPTISTAPPTIERPISKRPAVQTPMVSKSERLLHRTFYITKDQSKALKRRAAESERPEDKDASAIVRAALDLYLSRF